MTPPKRRLNLKSTTKRKTTNNTRGANREFVRKSDKTTASKSDVISNDSDPAKTRASEGNDSTEVSSHAPASDESNDGQGQQSSTNPNTDPSNKNLDPAILDLISGPESVSSDIDKYNERVKRKEAARTAMAAISVASQDSTNNNADEQSEDDSNPTEGLGSKKKSKKDNDILELKKKLLEEEEKNKQWLLQQKRVSAQKRKRVAGNDLFSGSTSYYSTAPVRQQVGGSVRSRTKKSDSAANYSDGSDEDYDTSDEDDDGPQSKRSKISDGFEMKIKELPKGQQAKEVVMHSNSNSDEHPSNQSEITNSNVSEETHENRSSDESHDLESTGHNTTQDLSNLHPENYASELIPGINLPLEFASNLPGAIFIAPAPAPGADISSVSSSGRPVNATSNNGGTSITTTRGPRFLPLTSNPTRSTSKSNSSQQPKGYHPTGKKSRAPVNNGWTAEDDELIIRCKEVENLSWRKIASKLEGRHSWQAIQMRYLRTHKSRGDSWSRFMEIRLIQAVKKDWEQRWKRISDDLGKNFSMERCFNKNLDMCQKIDTPYVSKMFENQEVLRNYVLDKHDIRDAESHKKLLMIYNGLDSITYDTDDDDDDDEDGNGDAGNDDDDEDGNGDGDNDDDDDEEDGDGDNEHDDNDDDEQDDTVTTQTPVSTKKSKESGKYQSQVNDNKEKVQAQNEDIDDEVVEADDPEVEAIEKGST
ncbi:unnamed protein product [Ambrosiozyma monospora]|uniref:Unnamed protein product n=1 Tax=Ambrosiozyma monospora TaxID=43982 RepID=A0A9W6YXT8_AMBMO|nr:unnamed protein product [Ambrosiozyma monospora]